MPVPTTTHWPIQPHTKAKHEILRRYLHAWLPMMAKYNGRIVFIDGFAGPGRYTGGEEGSPIIALRALLEHAYFQGKLAGREVVFIFIEEDADRADALRAELDRLQASKTIPAWIKVGVKCGTFAAHLTEVLDTIQARGTQLAPTFMLVDPFGFAGVPMDVIARVVRNPRCECLISFMYESVNRFISHPEPMIQARFDELFGTAEWRGLCDLKDPGQRREAIVNLYRRQLIEVGGLAYVSTFEMINEGNRTEYFLYFGTKSPDGFSKMKEAMWRADPIQGQAFSDLTDTRQEVLLEPSADMTPLRNALVRRFRGAGEISIGEVERFVLFDTPYSERIHLKERTLTPMEKERLITARHPHRKRRRHTYPDGTLITFV